MFLTVRQALTSPTFFVQCTISFLINGAINGVIAWGTMSNWGKRSETAQYPFISVWDWNYELNSCCALDVFLTGFFISYFSVLLGSGGVHKDVREKKCEMLDPQALRVGIWPWTPVGILNVCLRSIVSGIYVSALIALPTLLLIWAAVGSGSVAGLDWCIFKGIWASFVAIPVFSIVFLGATDARHFRADLEFEQLVAAGAAYENTQDPPAAYSAPVGNGTKMIL